MSYLDESEYDDRSRDDRSRRDRSRDERSRDDRSRDDRSRDERARDERARDEAARDERAPDEGDDRSRDGRPGGRRASQPARPAWDAATYGTPDDLRRTRPPASPSSPRGRGYDGSTGTSDPYRSPYSADRYPPAPSTPDPYTPAPEPYAPNPYASDPYAPSPYSQDPDSYAAEPYPPSSSSPDPYPPSYSTDPYPPGSYPPSASPPDRYSTPPSRHSSTLPEDLYPAATTSSPYTPEPYPPDPYRPDGGYSPGSDPYAASAFPSEPYPGPPAPNSYAQPPDPYPPPPDPYAGAQGSEPFPGDGQPAGSPMDPVSGRPPGRRRNGRGPDPADQYPGGAPPEDSAAPQPSGGRAGRNLPAAIGVGVLLGGIAVASLFVWRPAFLGVLVVAVGIGVWELVRAIRTSDASPPLIPLVAGGALMMGLAWWGHADALTFGLMITVLAAMVWRLADGTGSYGRDVAAATLVAVYLPFLAGFAALLATPPDGDRRVLVMLAGVVLSDTGGYIAGVLFGRHPMAPSVSPKKSWEGLVGSLIATAVGGALLLHFLFHVSFAWGAVFGLAVCVAAVVGDLGESMLKRDLGVKDMSQLLPGHGGLMDRLDSIVLAAPTAYLLLLFLAPPL